MRALITGGHGFVGRHLAKHLVECGDDVAATYLPAQLESEERGIPLPQSAQSLALDVTDREAVQEVVSLLRPDVIYHLAGLAFVPDGENSFDTMFAINAGGALNVMEAVLEHSPKSALLFVSSAEVYGIPRPKGLPLTELSELRPISNYGVAKATADLAAFKHFHRDRLNVVRVRPFPHIGPGQSESFAVSSFAKQVAEIKLGRSEPVIKVGNLEVKRDYSDVSDIVRGYREAVLNGITGNVYNLCSGKSVEIGDALQTLLKVADIEAEIVKDPKRVRPVDIPDLCGSYERARKDFGWAPRVDLEVTLNTIVDYWLEQLSQ